MYLRNTGPNITIQDGADEFVLSGVAAAMPIYDEAGATWVMRNWVFDPLTGKLLSNDRIGRIWLYGWYEAEESALPSEAVKNIAHKKYFEWVIKEGRDPLDVLDKDQAYSTQLWAFSLRMRSGYRGVTVSGFSLVLDTWADLNSLNKRKAWLPPARLGDSGYRELALDADEKAGLYYNKDEGDWSLSGCYSWHDVDNEKGFVYRYQLTDQTSIALYPMRIFETSHMAKTYIQQQAQFALQKLQGS